MGETAEPVQFWYNLKTQQVEQGKLSAAVYRVGPFETAAEAANALEIIKARSAKWSEQEESDR